MRNHPRNYVRDEQGSSTVEFVLLLAPLMAFMFGFFHMCMMMFTVTQLHWAAEDAARCASVRIECRAGGISTGSPNAAAIKTWASNHYRGHAAPTFNYDETDATCPHKVTGSATYSMNLPLFSRSFTLNSRACFS